MKAEAIGKIERCPHCGETIGLTIEPDWREHTCGECGYFGVPLEMLTKRKYCEEPHECRKSECEVWSGLPACPDFVAREASDE